MTGSYISISPLERGDLGSRILPSNDWVVVWRISLLRGDEGVCYGERRSKAKDVLLLLGKVVSVGFEWLFLI